MRWNDSRGQVALFFAVGLVLLFFIAIAFLLLTKSVPKTEEEKIISDITNNAALNSRIISCIDAAAKETLLELGKGGGLPFDDASRLVDYPSATVTLPDGTSRRVIYGITRNREETPILRNIPPRGTTGAGSPNYLDSSGNRITFATMLLTSSALGAPEFLYASDGYFGDVNFPAVCKEGGGCVRYFPYDYDNHLGLGSHPTQGLTTQEVLEKQIASSVQSCIDTNVLSDIIGRRITALSLPNAVVTFAKQATLMRVNYPLKVEGSSTTITLPFDRRYSVRYMKIAEFAFALAQEDSRDARFNITTDVSNSKMQNFFDADFAVTKIRDVAVANSEPAWFSGVSPSLKADLVVITDTKSRLDKDPFQFSFLIEHRYPFFSGGACETANADDPDETSLTVTSISPCSIQNSHILSDSP